MLSALRGAFNRVPLDSCRRALPRVFAANFAKKKDEGSSGGGRDSNVNRLLKVRLRKDRMTANISGLFGSVTVMAVSVSLLFTVC